MIGFDKEPGSSSLHPADLISHWRYSFLPRKTREEMEGLVCTLLIRKTPGSSLLQLQGSCWVGKPWFCKTGSPGTHIITIPDLFASKLFPLQGHRPKGQPQSVLFRSHHVTPKVLSPTLHGGAKQPRHSQVGWEWQVINGVKSLEERFWGPDRVSRLNIPQVNLNFK